MHFRSHMLINGLCQVLLIYTVINYVPADIFIMEKAIQITSVKLYSFDHLDIMSHTCCFAKIYLVSGATHSADIFHQVRPP